MTGDMFGAANSTCGDPRRFRRTSTVIVTLRRVKCPQGRDGRRTSSMMTKPIISSRKSHTSHKRSLVATAARAAGPRAPGRAGRAAGARSCHIAGLVFAPVRPGFVAACMVDSPGSGRVPGAGGPRWIGQSETDKRNILPMTGKGLHGCAAFRNFRCTTAGRGPRPALGYVE
jgi:hypothetical protein